ncbi:MAG: peroxide stress protein YaaA [Arcanobacterium sp.]|nr:peroxide stress protein YaaA [Arcanobacterium sp.]MDY5589681.1 peroxide stress protein YaaA [Arcanobacterium sp.]
MKILLPPSERKTAPPAGSPLALASLSFPQLTEQRQAVIEELQRVSARSDALSVLKVGKSLSAAVGEQAHLMQLPCALAWQVYSGVLYEAMAVQELFGAPDSSAVSSHYYDRIRTMILVFSGVFGVHTLTDLIPAYRLAMGVGLPQLGSVATFWKRELAPEQLTDDELVVDCRSGAYRVWDPPATAQQVEVQVVRDHDGKRSVVSHRAKYYRGLLAGELLRADVLPETAQELADFAHVLVERGNLCGVELAAAGRAGGACTQRSRAQPYVLTLVEGQRELW